MFLIWSRWSSFFDKLCMRKKRNSKNQKIDRSIFQFLEFQFLVKNLPEKKELQIFQ